MLLKTLFGRAECQGREHQCEWGGLRDDYPDDCGLYNCCVGCTARTAQPGEGDCRNQDKEPKGNPGSLGGPLSHVEFYLTGQPRVSLKVIRCDDERAEG